VDRDLYGRTIACALIGLLRPERRFDGLEALKAQITQDCAAARLRLGA
jgi:riboflavin kinase / FMN adenylyltransferase